MTAPNDGAGSSSVALGVETSNHCFATQLPSTAERHGVERRKLGEQKDVQYPRRDMPAGAAAYAPPPRLREDKKTCITRLRHKVGGDRHAPAARREVHDHIRASRALLARVRVDRLVRPHG